MRTSFKAVTAGFVLSSVLMPLGPFAWAGPKEDVAAATSRWAQALGEDDPEKVLPLYADDAVLWGGRCRLRYAPTGRHCGTTS